MECGKIEEVPAYGVKVRMGNFELDLCKECREKHKQREVKKTKTTTAVIDNQLKLF
jgi:PHP family Zn ribbon phosphoesterase